MTDEWSAWLTTTMYFVGQHYNYLLLVRKVYFDSSKFCSELVAGVMARRNIPMFVGRPHTAFAPNDLRWDKLRDHGWTNFTQEFKRYLGSPTLPSAPEQAGQKTMTERSFVGLTESTTELIETFAWSLLRQIEKIKVGRAFQATVSLETDLVRNLQDRVKQARNHLELLEGVSVAQRGAPWIGGEVSYLRRIAAVRSLRTAMHQAERFMKAPAEKER